MQVRQKNLKAPNTNITQDYTVPGFGTPQAAIVMWNNNHSGVWGNNANIGMGFWDGTNQRLATAGYDHGDLLDSGSGRAAWDPANIVWYIINGNSANERKAAITSTVTDGVQLTWTGNDPTNSLPYVTVILLKGLNGAQTGFKTVSDTDGVTTDITTTGITPKLILFASRLSNFDTVSHGGTPRVSWGFACDNGSTLDNYTHGWYNRHDQNPTDMSGAVRDDACVFLDRATNNYCDVTTMTVDKFTVTSRINGGVFANSLIYLALDFDESVIGGSSTPPTGAGDWDSFDAGFTPQWAFMIPTGVAALNTTYNGDEDGVESHHLYSVIKNPASSAAIDEDSHNVIVENGTTTTIYSQGRHQTGIMINRVSGSTTPEDLMTGDSPTFDDSGVVFADADILVGGGTHQVIGFFVEEEFAGENTDILVPMGPIR